MELGGKVSISCAKTGYYANIEFLTKVIEICKTFNHVYIILVI